MNYDSWGKPEPKITGDLNLSGLEKSINFTIHDYDERSGKYFAQSRMYDPDSKRFISKDQYLYWGNNDISKKGLNEINPNPETDTNIYIYGDNNPVNTYDPLGWAWEYVGTTSSGIAKSGSSSNKTSSSGSGSYKIAQSGKSPDNSSR